MPVSPTMIDVGECSYHQPVAVCNPCGAASYPVIRIRIAAQGHCSKVFADDRIWLSDSFQFSMFEPDGRVTQVLHSRHVVGNEQDGFAVLLHLANPSHAALLEVNVPYGERFIDEQDPGIDVAGHRER